MTKPLTLMLLIGLTGFWTIPSAFATAELKLSDGNGHTADVVASSCGVGCSTASFMGALGDWNINNPTGTAQQGGSPLIDLNSIDHHNASNGPTTLTIEWSVDGLTPSVPGFQLNIGGTVGKGGTVTAALYGGTSDTRFDLSNQIGSTLTFGGPSISFSGSESAYVPGGTNSPYALTEVATITFGSNAGQASFDYSVDIVPEPTAILLLGTVILGSVLAYRRKLTSKTN